MRPMKLISLSTSASTITLSLFAVMQSLVGNDGEVVLDESRPLPVVDMNFAETPQKPTYRSPKVEKIPVVEEPKIGDPPPVSPTTGPKSIPFGPVPKPGGRDKMTLDPPTASDGAMIPLVTTQPIFPSRCAERGLNGYVTVSLTVNSDGTTSDIEVIDQDDSHCFASAAVKAAAGFKYKPQIVNGKGQAVFDVRYRFAFALES